MARKRKPRIVTISSLKPGDRFSFIPPAWHGPGRVLTSGPSGNGECWRVSFDNNRVINPPGITYDKPDRLVRRLA